MTTEEILAGADLANLTAGIDTTPTQEQMSKVDILQQNKQAKLDNLSSKLGTIAQQRYNTLSAEELQYVVGDAFNEQVYDAGTNNAYQLKRINGELNKVPYLGKTRDLYIAPTDEGNMKLGLAATGKGFEGRYTPDWKQYVPFMKGYGWEAGDKGVDPTNPDYVNATLPYDLATNLERVVHANKGQVENRVGGNTYADYDRMSQQSELGGGASEYTTKNAPLWNINYQQKEEELGADVRLPKEIVDRNAVRVDAEGNLIPTKSVTEDDGYLGNLVDAAQYGVGSAIARVGDAIADAMVTEDTGKWLNEKLGDDWVSKTGNVTALDKYKLAKEYGYDDSAIQEYTNEFKNVWSNPETSWVDKALVTLKAVKHAPEVLASSSGDIALGMFGVPGLAAMAVGQSNEMLAEREQIKGKLEAEDYAIVAPFAIAYAAVNMFTKGNAGLADTKKVVAEAMKNMDGGAMQKLMAGGYALAKEANKDGITEGLEEIFQGYTEELGTKLGTAKQDEILSKETLLEQGAAGALGYGAGVAGKTVGEVKGAIQDSTTGLTDSINEKVDEFRGTESSRQAKEQEKSIYERDYNDLTNEMVQRVAAMDERAAKGEATSPEEYKIMSAIHKELKRRDAANEIEKLAKAGTLGALSDVEEGIRAKGLMKDESKLADDITTILDTYISSEALADVHVALKNAAPEGVDKEQWNNTIDEAVNARIALDNLTEGAKAARSGVVIEGLTPAEDKKGYAEYARLAMAGDEDAYNQFARFTQSQINKMDKLVELESRATDIVNERIDSIQKTVGEGVTKEDIVKAMVYLTKGDNSNVTLDEDNIKALRPAYDKVSKKLKEVKGEDAWKELEWNGEAVADYSEEYYSISNNPGLFKQKLHFMLPKITNDLGITDIKWNEGRDKAPVSKVIEYISDEVNDMKRLYDYVGKTRFSAKDDASLDTEAKESNVEEDVKENVPEQDTYEKSEKETATTEKEEPKPTKLIDKSISDMDVQELKTLSEYNTKNLDENGKTKVAEAKKELDKRLDEIVNDSNIEVAAAIEELDRIVDVKERYQKELKDLEGANAELTGKAKEISNINKKLYTLLETKKEMEAVLKVQKKQIAEDEKMVKELEEEMLKVARESKAGIVNIVKKALKDGDVKVAHNALLDKIVNVLKGAKKKAAQLVRRLLGRAKALSNRAGKLKLDNKKIEARLDEIALEIYNLEVQKDELGIDKETKQFMAKQNALRNEIKQAKAEESILKEKVSGRGYSQVLLLESKRGKKGSEKAFPGVKKHMPLDANKIAKTGGKSSSILSKQKLTEVTDSTQKMIDSMKKLGIIPTKVTDQTFAEFPYLMLLLDKNGDVNNNVAAAMTTAGLNWMSENKASLTKLTERDIESYYGVTLDTDPEMYEKVQHMGIPTKYAANSIKKSIEKMLGLKPIQGMEEAYDKMVLGLAQAALYSNMGKEGILQEYREKYENEAETITVKLKQDEKTLNVVDKHLKNKSKALDELYKVTYDKATFRTETKDITTKDVKIRRNDLTKPTEEQAKALVKYTNLAWNPIDAVVKLMNELNDDTLKSLLGYEKEDATLDIGNRDSVRGRNLQIEADIEHMREFNKAYLDGEMPEGAYFDWYITKVGRNSIDSATFNPATKKLHRYMGVYEAQTGTVKPGDISEDIFKMGVAQGLGFDVDKEPISASKEFADAVLTEFNLVKLRSAIKAGKTKLTVKDANGKEVELKIKEISHAIMALVEGERYVAAAGKPFKTSMVLESDGLTNGFAFKMLQYLVTKEDTTTLDKHLLTWLEKAGITVGKDKVAAMVDRIKAGNLDVKSEEGIIDAYRTLGMEIPSKNEDAESSKSMEETALEGIDETIKEATTNPEASTSSNEEQAKHLGQVEILLAYGALKDTEGKLKTPGDATKVKETVSKFLATQASLTDAKGMITKAARDLMKPPFMTFGYGAGFKSILNAVTGVVEAEMLKELSKPGPFTEEEKTQNDKVWEFARSIGFTENRQAELRTKYATEIMVNGISLHDHIRNHVQLSYGKRIEEVLGREFKALAKVNKELIDGATAMFHIWKTVYDKLANVEGNTVPTREVHEKVMEMTKSIFPYVDSPLGKDKYKDGVPLVKAATGTVVENPYGETKVKLDKEAVNGSESASVRGISNLAYDSIGVGAVVNLNQMIDGASMTNIMNKYELQQIFDALIIGVEQADAVSSYNEEFAKFALTNDWTHIGTISDRLTEIMYSKELKELLDKIGMTRQELETVVHGKMVEGKSKSAANKTGKITDIMNTLTRRNVENKMARAELRKQDIVFEQMVLDGKHVYVHKGEVSTSEELDTYAAEAETKQNTGTIQKEIEQDAEKAVDKCNVEG